MSEHRLADKRLPYPKRIPHSWRKGEPLIYTHGENGNHCLRPERFERECAPAADSTGLIWFTDKTACDDWLQWWNSAECSKDDPDADHDWELSEYDPSVGLTTNGRTCTACGRFEYVDYEGDFDDNYF